MVGFGLKNYEDRVPCPHCGSTDCCGIRTDKIGRQTLFCITTKKRVTAKTLEESAKKHNLQRRHCDFCWEDHNKYEPATVKLRDPANDDLWYLCDSHKEQMQSKREIPKRNIRPF